MKTIRPLRFVARITVLRLPKFSNPQNNTPPHPPISINADETAIG
jgi:hypothetical protein